MAFYLCHCICNTCMAVGRWLAGGLSTSVRWAAPALAMLRPWPFELDGCRFICLSCHEWTTTRMNGSWAPKKAGFQERIVEFCATLIYFVCNIKDSTVKRASNPITLCFSHHSNSLFDNFGDENISCQTDPAILSTWCRLSRGGKYELPFAARISWFPLNTTP